MKKFFLFVLLACLWSGAAAAHPAPPKTYDKQIRAAAEKFLPGIPWNLWKAQLYQESRLDPNARSPVGAEGLAQFMPATWVEVSKAMGYGLIDRRLAGPAIEGGAYYMSRQRLFFKQIQDLEKHKFAAASYNAGAGNILKMRRACPYFTWAEASVCLEQVTGRHSKETLTYIQRIWHYWPELEVAR